MQSIQMILAVFVVVALCGTDYSYNTYQGQRNNRGRGYCTNSGCRSGYNYYGNNGNCKYGNRSYKFDCHSFAGCCLPRDNPYSKFNYYCIYEKGCPDNYYFYNNKGYYYYNNKDYYNCRSYRGCYIRRG
ncbi:uncharacterized protein LOC143061978 [Mytilus galloprovincialis]|uniref:uncharacterized protein LOC143061978 n=1 Tax=Mytilus galloprovincialis TaxID=29158 RepID=UPI003F7B9B52